MLQRAFAVLVILATDLAGCVFFDQDTKPSRMRLDGWEAADPTVDGQRVEAGDGGEPTDSAQQIATAPDWPGGAMPAGLRRHIILVIGDGMQLAHEIAASRYLTGRDEGLSFHAFPVQAYQTTWDVAVYNFHAAARGLPAYSPVSFDPTVGYDPELGGEAPYPVVPDNEKRRDYFVNSPAGYSSSTGTAMSTGTKTDPDNLAWLPGDPEGGALESSPEMLRRSYGMSIGYATSGPITHATPAAWFSHNRDRYDYYNIGHEIFTVVRPEVAIGGATASFVDAADIEAARASGDYVMVERTIGVDGAMALLAGAVMANQDKKKLLGLFGEAGGSFVSPVPLDHFGLPELVHPADEDPSLADASIAALEVLSRDPDGFFLLVEQEDIDLANHANDFARMIGCVQDLDEAVQAIVAFVDRPDDPVDWTNTTVIVTADHANSYLRLEKPLDRGDLPTQVMTDSGWSYPDGDVSYGTGGHTNELVTVRARGWAAERLMAYATAYPGLDVIDNTSIFLLTLDAARR